MAATDPEAGGVISPGGVGYDINCGVRLLRTELTWDEVKPRIRPLVDELFREIPTGVGQRGRFLFDKPKLSRLMELGSAYVVEQGWGLLELKLVSMTLEDVFLRLTQHEDGVLKRDENSGRDRDPIEPSGPVAQSRSN